MGRGSSQTVSRGGMLFGATRQRVRTAPVATSQADLTSYQELVQALFKGEPSLYQATVRFMQDHKVADWFGVCGGLSPSPPSHVAQPFNDVQRALAYRYAEQEHVNACRDGVAMGVYLARECDVGYNPGSFGNAVTNGLLHTKIDLLMTDGTVVTYSQFERKANEIFRSATETFIAGVMQRNEEAILSKLGLVGEPKGRSRCWSTMAYHLNKNLKDGMTSEEATDELRIMLLRYGGMSAA
jgi:hypothetical protein